MTELERYITLGEVEISRHPKSNQRRLAVETSFVHKRFPGIIRVEFEVHYLEEDGTRSIPTKSTQPYQVILEADEETKIDPVTMTADPEGAISEYDFFVAASNQPTNIFQLRLDTIKLRFSQGKFD